MTYSLYNIILKYVDHVEFPKIIIQLINGRTVCNTEHLWQRYENLSGGNYN